MEAYLDARFGIHADGKSHTGGVPVFCGSKEQKCMTKSSTEVELVGPLYNLSFVELFAEFMEIILNQPMREPEIYQDTTSAISLVTQGLVS
jgi:hypothetical protein